MKIAVSSKDLSRLEADLAVCFAYEDDEEPRSVEEIELRRALAREMRAERFRGLPTDRVIWNADGRYRAHRFLVVGLGRERTTPGEAIRIGAARAAREASRLVARSVALRIPDAEAGHRPEEVRAAVEGAMLGDYHFARHLTDKTRHRARLRSIEVSVPGSPRGMSLAAERGELGARAVWLARDLVNEGPSRLNPPAFARLALRQARSSGLGCSVLDEARIRRLGMHALRAVARGSKQPARVVHLVYRPRGRRAAKRIVLVGKGVTFDSGGLNLKPGDSMLTMKMDMAGAAAVLAAMTTLHAVGCRAEVHALLGLVENMGGADAYKPGDILDTLSGKTVEVMNTDAEGRLVLCDLLAHAVKKLRPGILVDLATLTGACVVALGPQAGGLFTRDDALADALVESARAAGEKLWRLPLYEEYLQLLQRGPADLRSTGGRWGGAITAALFLGEFVPRELSWAHLDIAGPAFAENELPEARIGGTGSGVLTLLRWLEAA